MSFKGYDRDDTKSIIPSDLSLFDTTDIVKVFNYLEKTFRLHHDWQKEFKKQLHTIPRGTSEQEFFFQYTRQHIDPALQKILRRNDSVIFALSRYIIRDKVREKRQQENHLKNFYKSDEWKKSKS